MPINQFLIVYLIMFYISKNIKKAIRIKNSFLSFSLVNIRLR